MHESHKESTWLLLFQHIEGGGREASLIKYIFKEYKTSRHPFCLVGIFFVIRKGKVLEIGYNRLHLGRGPFYLYASFAIDKKDRRDALSAQ